MSTLPEALARQADLQSDTNRLIANIIRDNLRDNPSCGMAMSRDFAQRVQELLAEVAQLPRGDLSLASMQGRCKALAGNLGELLEKA